MAMLVELQTQAVDLGIHLIGNSAQVGKEPAKVAHGVHGIHERPQFLPCQFKMSEPESPVTHDRSAAGSAEISVAASRSRRDAFIWRSSFLISTRCFGLKASDG
jgi:hypothetical protein